MSKNKGKNKGKNKRKELMKMTKKFKKEMSKAQREMMAVCCHGSRKKNFLTKFRVENEMKVATCKDCTAVVCVDEEIIYSAQELTEAARILDSAAALAIVTSERSDSKKDRLSPEAVNRIMKFRANLHGFTDERIDYIESFEDDDEDDNTFTPKKDKKKKKNSNKTLF